MLAMKVEDWRGAEIWISLEKRYRGVRIVLERVLPCLGKSFDQRQPTIIIVVETILW